MSALLAALLASSALAASRPAVLSSATVSSPYDLAGATLPAAGYSAGMPFFPEVLEFEIKWGIFSVGTSDLRLERVLDFGGTPAFYLASQARSNGFCDRFYPVRDLNESWIRASDRASLGYSKKLREGSFFRDEWVLYDYPRKAFLSKRTDKDGSSAFSAGEIPGPVQDILSSIYYIRPSPLKVGDEVVLDVNTKSNWPLSIKVLKRATIEIPSGRYKCVVVEPFLRQEGLFVQKGKRLQVWLTDDARHMPVLMRVELLFGSVTAYLVKASPPYKAP
ncbi:MAG TPA: DUF3108 domain-containing protein [Elusimicrobiota bacterium]|nr:DUF3108 domain-containing protein [Elusimicrobiota bacterium]